MKTPTHADMIAGNKQAWNQSARFHRQSPAWQRLANHIGRAEFSCLDATLTHCLTEAGVMGCDVIQLGCNNGREVFSLFALGARRVVGVDQSSAFLQQAGELNACSPHPAEFVEADIHQLPATLQGAFDVALITIGVLNWMPDLNAFMQCVASTLRPGGRLVIYETHPFLEMFDPEGADPFSPTDSYFREAPEVSDEAILYEGDATATGAPSYWHIHTLSDILTSLIAGGLRISQFQEFAHSNREEAYDRYEQRAAQLPLCYTLTAVRN
ncbi:class I SAM-dependent methyltransferase [Pseudomonas putida]